MASASLSGQEISKVSERERETEKMKKERKKERNSQ